MTRRASPRPHLRIAALSLAALAALAAACGPTGGSSPGGGQGPAFPQPQPPGNPIGDPTEQSVGGQGGALASLDGLVVVDIPPGAVASTVPFTVVPIANLAPSGVGGAYRLGPEGTTFAKPVGITFYAALVGLPIDELGVAFQDGTGFWHRAAPESVTRDPVAQTLTVSTNHFSSWTLTTASTARDLTGPFVVTTTMGTPVTATGTATFTFAGEDTAAVYYLLSGTITLPSPLTSGATTCTPTPPETPAFALRTNVAELTATTPPHFFWGTSGLWNVTCADGTTQLVTVAFDTEGIGFVGCTPTWNAAELAGAAATRGNLSHACGTRGQVSGAWDFQSVACGTPCVSTNPCHIATVQCGSGTATCVDSGNVADGSSCGTSQVCSAGVCVGCTTGLACAPPNPCVAGVTSCATGTSVCVESTAPPTPIADGTTCGVDQVCSVGSCLACVANVACTPAANPCHAGTTSCATGASVCVDSGAAVADGTSCGTNLTCYSGACLACAQGTICTSANPCAATATYECSSGAAVCTDRALQPAGTACGTGLVCSATGTCGGCVEGGSCAPPNACVTTAAVACGTGSPVCTATGFAAAGTACGTGQVCSGTGQCVTCAAGGACTPPGNPCGVGTFSCTTGVPVCVETGPAPNGTPCGTNLVCSTGVCVACTQGAVCTSSNPCTATATVQCGTGSQVCTDQTFRAAGASCGTNQVCSSAHVCTACTQGAVCTSSNPCASSATTQCGSGAPVCADQFFVAAGTSCGTNRVCSAGGACNACTQGAACTPTNPCAATGTTACGSGAPVCAPQTFLADGASCGTGQTCNAGTCVASRTVTGTRTATYWPDAGAQAPVAAPDAATAAAAALVSDGKGGWSTYAGTVSAAGAVSIPRVPAGSFWFRFRDGSGATTYLDTAGGTPVDLGYDQLGRGNVSRATASTQVTFTVALPSGNPNVTWGTANLDQLQMASSNADVWDRLTPVTLQGNRRSGTWRDNWFTGFAGGTPLNLVLTGDALAIYHMVLRTDATANQNYLAAGGVISSTGLTVVSGQNQTVSNRTLSTAGLQSRTLAGGTWSLTAFEALRTAMNLPTAAAATHSLVVGASRGTLTGNGPVPRAVPNLFTMSVTGGATANVTLGSALAYNRVLNTALWNDWRGVDFTGSVTFTAPGATTGFTESVSVGRREAMPAATALTPSLTPVQNLEFVATTSLVSPAYGSVTGTGLTPTLRWAPPFTGVATSYTVEVFRLAVSGTATTSTKVATFVTGGTSVAIPTGVLAAGSAHYARVTARAIASDPWANAPFRRVVAGAWAATLTGAFTP